MVDAKDYKPKGEKSELSNGVKLYTVGDKSNPAIIVLNDIFGMNCGRHYGVADSYAERGFYVLMPDVFHGETDGSYFTWDDYKNGKIGEYVPRYPLEGVQEDLDLCYAKLEGKKVGLIGMCWGSWIIAHESARKAPFVCGAMVHPALGLAGMFGSTSDDLIKTLNDHPMIVFPCKDDDDNMRPGNTLHQHLGDKVDIHEVDACNHGFFTQGDLSDETIARHVEIVFEKTTAFFKKYLK